MTFPNEPGTNPPRYQRSPYERSNRNMWVAGLVAVLLILGLLIFGPSNPDTQTASNRPTVTTGSGAMTTPRPTPAAPANPAGTTPTAPAPATPAR